MAEPDPLQLADMLAASAWWPQLAPEDQALTLAQTERPLEPDARVARCLAELSGVSRQRVNQALQVLSRAGLLELAYGRVRILDLAGRRGFGG